MTTPNGDVPSGSLGTGQFAEWQAMTEEDAKAQMRQPLNSFQNAQDNEHAKWGGFLGIANFLTGLTNAFTGTSDGGGIFSGIFNRAQEQKQAEVDLTNRVEQLEGGGTRTTYAIASTWTNPGPGYIVTVACVNGGQGGYHGGSGTTGAAGGRGGVGGGWVEETFDSEALGSTETVTPGAGGVANGGLGGVSTFGTHVTGVRGVGALITSKGAFETSSKPGNGGDGADFFDGAATSSGQSGGSSALAAGGAGSSGSVTASAGATPISDPLIAAGGGGGGGGGVSGSGAGGDGGAGNFGSGGGGGGAGSNSTVRGEGAPGGSGRVIVTVKARTV